MVLYGFRNAEDALCIREHFWLKSAAVHAVITIRMFREAKGMADLPSEQSKRGLGQDRKAGVNC